MKNNKGRVTLSFILSILILLLLIFLGYEIVYVDIFNIMPDETTPIASSNYIDDINQIDINNQDINNLNNAINNNDANSGNSGNSGGSANSANTTNVETIVPTINNNMRL